MLDHPVCNSGAAALRTADAPPGAPRPIGRGWPSRSRTAGRCARAPPWRSGIGCLVQVEQARRTCAQQAISTMRPAGPGLLAQTAAQSPRTHPPAACPRSRPGAVADICRANSVSTDTTPPADRLNPTVGHREHKSTSGLVLVLPVPGASTLIGVSSALILPANTCLAKAATKGPSSSRCPPPTASASCGSRSGRHGRRSGTAGTAADGSRTSSSRSARVTRRRQSSARSGATAPGPGRWLST